MADVHSSGSSSPGPLLAEAERRRLELDQAERWLQSDPAQRRIVTRALAAALVLHATILVAKMPNWGPDPVRVDAPLGQSHQWVDPAGGERFFHAEYHADHFAIMGQGVIDMAMRALTDNNLELWVKNRWNQEVRLRRTPLLEGRIMLDVAYFPDSSGLEFNLRRR